ncbi:MAG: DUF3421 domain-containing protein [Deltaproteobacteria bacterium]|nr:DUF3421 domain-containing protein [Deltaproteobacteria bacterium]
MKRTHLSLAIFAFMAVSYTRTAEASWYSWDSTKSPRGEHTLGGFEYNNGNPQNQLWVCRALKDGVWHPGKLVQASRVCNIGWGGGELSFSSYQILEGVGTWGPNGLNNSLIGGIENGNNLHVCRATVVSGGLPRGIHPGKLLGGACHVPYGGSELTFSSYQLFYPSTTTPNVTPASGKGNLSVFLAYDDGPTPVIKFGEAFRFVDNTEYPIVPHPMLIYKVVGGSVVYRQQHNGFFNSISPGVKELRGPYSSCKTVFITAGSTATYHLTRYPTTCN